MEHVVVDHFQPGARADNASSAKIPARRARQFASRTEPTVTLQVKVSNRHQITVPAAVRRSLSIEAGDNLQVEVHDGVVFLIPKPDDPVEGLRGLGQEIWDDIDVQDYLNREREGW
jgi:AbrB family looped-hinge helix DNA binding protein